MSVPFGLPNYLLLLLLLLLLLFNLYKVGLLGGRKMKAIGLPFFIGFQVA